MMSLSMQALCALLHSYRFLRLIGSKAKQQTDQLPQLSSRKGKYRAPPNLGEGFISLTFPIIRQGFCYRLVFSHHSYILIFRALGSYFAIVPLAALHPFTCLIILLPIWHLVSLAKDVPGLPVPLPPPFSPPLFGLCGFFPLLLFGSVCFAPSLSLSPFLVHSCAWIF